MDVTIDTSDGFSVVALAGEVDGRTAPVVQDKVVPVLGPDSKVLLDLSAVTFLSSAGLRLLLVLYRQAAAAKGKLALVAVPEEVQDTMSATGFLSHFSLYENVPEAKAGLLSGGAGV